MTAVDREPDLNTDEFEAIARAAARETEGVQLEYIDGRLGVKAVPDGDHNRIFIWLLLLLMPLSPRLFLHPNQGLQVGTYRKGRARPDGVVAPVDAFVGTGEWAVPDPVVMAVEITTRDSDTNARDRVEKPNAYAQCGIPIYLLIDRDAAEVSVFSEPSEGRYEETRRYGFGRPVPLPPPLGLTLDTTPLQDWVD
ncbi:Uma2 family endonuclease [Nocardia huaxiensis]|uniref:Uma2 family endonuclease n=1 Tax=Nocardia huaxiensis TaxID=2755382 RepID=A0A7D6ZPV2_9NOCA|nr:Uma2 family endonuclease [Nocardia huaxiensis]QLY32423.1 Uma2 family endonuclease [Nocardia huaxiensis]UFS93865.1 Uma2 family endonuclease [Nocardia huaxiensis]